MAIIDTQFRNTELEKHKSHYDLVALDIFKFMHQVYNSLKFTFHDFLNYHSDPLSAINAIEQDFDLNSYEKSCIVSVRVCFTAMKKNYGNDEEMPTRIQFLRQNLLGLFQSMKVRETPAGERRVANFSAGHIAASRTLPAGHESLHDLATSQAEADASSRFRYGPKRPIFSSSDDWFGATAGQHSLLVETRCVSRHPRHVRYPCSCCPSDVIESFCHSKIELAHSFEWEHSTFGIRS